MIVVVLVLDEELIGAANRVEDIPVVEVELEGFEAADQVQGQVRHLDEQDPLELYLLLCIHLNERRSEDFNHFAIGDDDPLLIKRVLVHFELVNSCDIRLLQAVCKRQGIVLIEEVDQSALLLLGATLLRAVGLHDADAVLLDEHGELHVRRPDRHLQLRDGEGAEDVLDVGGELGAGDHLLMQVEGETDDRAQSRDQVHLGLKLERLLLRLVATALSALTNLGVKAGQVCARLSLGKSLGLRNDFK